MLAYELHPSLCVFSGSLNFSPYISLTCHISVPFPLYLYFVQRFPLNPSPIPYYNNKIPFSIPIHHLLSIFPANKYFRAQKPRQGVGAYNPWSSVLMLPPLPLYGKEKKVACNVECGRGTLYPLKCEQLWRRVKRWRESKAACNAVPWASPSPCMAPVGGTLRPQRCPLRVGPLLSLQI
jgi:hypothetical protein